MGTWAYFSLLMWKNFLIKYRHKIELLIEILVPIAFSLTIMAIRGVASPEVIAQPTIFKAQPINNLTGLYPRFLQKFDIQLWEVDYTPNHPLLETLMKDAASSINPPFGVRSFDTPQELQRFIMTNYSIAGVVFHTTPEELNSGLPKKLKFSLRFPGGLRTGRRVGVTTTWETRLLFPIQFSQGPRNLPHDDGGTPPGYIPEGFTALQNAISASFVKIAGQIDKSPSVMLQRFPFKPYTNDPIIFALEVMVAFIILLSFVYPLIQAVKHVTTEKELQLKEAMKIMGLTTSLHWAAWFFTLWLCLAVTVVIIVCIVKIPWFDDFSLAVFTHTSSSLLLVFLLLYVMSLVTFSFMISTFFTKANVAAAIGGLAWFAFYIPYSFTLNQFITMGIETKLAFSLFVNTAMSFGFKIIVNWEAAGKGAQWDNLFDTITIEENLTLGYIMIMMVVDTVLHMLVALYVEKVMPGTYGRLYKWYFPVQPSFWFPKKTKYIDNGVTFVADKDRFEPEVGLGKAGIKLLNLRKKFGNKIAVDNINLNMYQDQITVLLGHNGAGKTTTISMITGLISPNSGTAIVNDIDIFDDMSEIRKSFGFCPQYNILFNELTVREHIIFYSKLKGLNNMEIEKEIDKYVTLLNLEDKRNAQAKTLSGGMKRKLSVGVALCGRSKVVLCDEPSSGMDPAARRSLWDLILAEKKGRTILLTTHFMDEADILGDRIAIMSAGKLRCSGTAFFLKKRFGTGYQLICSKKEDCKPDHITDMIKKYIPEIYVKSDVGSELSYDLPEKYTYQFERMLKDLEDSQEQLKVNGYGISMTTLEDVFMKTGSEMMSDDKIENTENGITNGTLNGIDNGTENNHPEVIGNEDNNGNIPNGNVDNGNVANGTPALGNFARVDASNGDVSAYSNSTTNSRNAIVMVEPKINSIDLVRGRKRTEYQWRAMLLKKYYNFIHNWYIFLIQLLIPILLTIISIYIPKKEVSDDLPALPLTLDKYGGTQTLLEKLDSNNVASGYENMFQTLGSANQLEVVTGKSMTDRIIQLQQQDLLRVNTRNMAAASVANNISIAWFNNEALHTAPLALNLMYNAIVRAYVGSDYSIEVINEPLPFSVDLKLEQLDLTGNLGFQLAVNITFGMAFTSGIFIMYMIKERVSRSKLLQFVSGVRLLTFWLVHLIWDFIAFALIAAALTIILLIYQEDGFATSNELGRVFLLFMTYGFGILPLIYLISLVYDDAATGMSRATMLNIFTGNALYVTAFVLSSKVFTDEDEGEVVKIIGLLFPSFTLAQGLSNQARLGVLEDVCEQASDLLGLSIPTLCNAGIIPECCNLDAFSWSEPGIANVITAMCVVGVVQFAVLLIIESRSYIISFFNLTGRIKNLPPASEDGHIDGDVQKEKTQVSQMNNYDIASHNLVMSDVTKYYKQFLAVNQLSLSIDKGECFGLLGVNGAGKTSTFKMMTGDESISHGDIWVKGYNTNGDRFTVYEMIGYCPQFDALIEDMTGRETLEMFCLLRGVPSHMIKSLIRQISRDLAFEKHLDKKCSQYSGGNRRKLSTAIAILGNPEVIFLDEPTTGIDPASRRKLWDLVCRIRDLGKAIVLTSHSMEECEALCTRIAIMVNGEFKCLGSTQHLKNKFAKDISLTIKLESMAELNGFHPGHSRVPSTAGSVSGFHLNEYGSRVQMFVNDHFHGAVLKDCHRNYLTFQIPKDVMPYSRIFGLMEANKQSLHIEDYSLSQSTLERIFLNFAEKQRTEEDSKALRKRKKKCICCC